MNSVEYSISLRDMASPAMRRFTTTVQRSNSVVNGATRNMLRRFISTQRAIQDNSRATRDMARDISALTRQVEMLYRSLERVATVRPKNGSVFGDLVRGNLASGAIAQMGQMAIDGVGKALNSAFERQKIQASYNILTGSEASGKVLVNELKGLMRDTMLGGEVFGAAQTMMAFGVQGDISKRIEQIGNVAIGDALKLQSLALALSQMSASGKLQGQDRLQMINAGWNPIKTLAEMTGKSVEVLNEEMSKGLISSDMVWKALDYVTREGGTFGGVLDAIAKTSAGQQMLLSGSIEELMVDVGEVMMPVVTDVMRLLNDYVMPLVTDYMPELSRGVERVWGVLKGWIEALSPIKEAFVAVTREGSLMREYVHGLGEVMESLLPVLGRLLSFVGGFVGDVVRLINSSEWLKLVWEGIEWSLKGMVEVIGWAVDILRGLWDTVLRPMLETYQRVERGVLRLLGVAPRKPRGSEVGAGGGSSSMHGESKSGELAAAQVVQLASMQSANAERATEVSSGVSGSGVKVVNITVDKLLDSITITSSDVREGAEEMEKIVLDVLARVLAQGATVAI